MPKMFLFNSSSCYNLKQCKKSPHFIVDLPIPDLSKFLFLHLVKLITPHRVAFVIWCGRCCCSVGTWNRSFCVEIVLWWQVLARTITRCSAARVFLINNIDHTQTFTLLKLCNRQLPAFIEQFLYDIFVYNFDLLTKLIQKVNATSSRNCGYTIN